MPGLNLFKVLKFITTHPLNSDQKFKVLLRFAKWQIGSRLIQGDIVYGWVNGAKFFVRTGETGLTQNIYTGLHEFVDMAFLLHALRSDDLFVDVGANVGSYTILACAAVGASGRSFEPVPGTFKRLSENIRLNHLEDRVKCFNIGIGRERGSMQFTSDLDTVNHALAPGEKAANTVNVEVSTLDEVLRGATPYLMKIDVEGYETPVLEGADETLKKPTLQAVIMELNGSGNRYGYDESRILKKMCDYGFRPYSYDPFSRSLINLLGKNLASGNTLFIRDVAAVQERMTNSPIVTVCGKQF